MQDGTAVTHRPPFTRGDHADATQVCTDRAGYSGPGSAAVAQDDTVSAHRPALIRRDGAQVCQDGPGWILGVYSGLSHLRPPATATVQYSIRPYGPPFSR